MEKNKNFINLRFINLRTFRTFIFDESKSKWVEEKQQLLSQDICVLLDEEEEIIYLWGGLKTSKKRFFIVSYVLYLLFLFQNSLVHKV